MRGNWRREDCLFHELANVHDTVFTHESKIDHSLVQGKRVEGGEIYTIALRLAGVLTCTILQVTYPLPKQNSLILIIVEHG